MAVSFHSKPISTLHLAWAAGFIEGEGSFSMTKGQSPKVTAAQVQKEPVERLRRLFGGNVTRRFTKGFSSQPIWVWALTARRSIEVMMTLYVLMSPKRQLQIEAALEKWKSARHLRPHHSNTCTRGHKIDPGNMYVTPAGHRRCRTCQLQAKKRYRDKDVTSIEFRKSSGGL